jgi:ribosomal protein S18 acetylase RimI-like enzyme
MPPSLPPSPLPPPDQPPAFRSGPGAALAKVLPIPPELRLAAAARLVGEATSDPFLAGRKFLESARTLKLDLSHFWGIVEPGTELLSLDASSLTPLRQVCLCIPGAGRTVMLFISPPVRSHRSWIGAGKRSAPPEVDHTDRVRLIREVCEELPRRLGGTASAGPPGHAPRLLAQALLEPADRDLARALRDAGFMQLGDLAYMTRQMPDRPGLELLAAIGQPLPGSPPGLRLESLDALARRGVSTLESDQLLCTALERSYIDTRDCPELCGLRDVRDVLASHRAIGVFDPTLWTIIWNDDEPSGCMLFSVSPEQGTVELVYLGLAPELRGQGLSGPILRRGLAQLYDTALSPRVVGHHPNVAGRGGVTCAVDARNEPAVRLYRRSGFQKTAVRVPLVRAIPMTLSGTQL